MWSPAVHGIATVALVALGPGLAAQSGSPVRADGDRWTQEWTGRAPGAKRIKVRSMGSVAVRGALGDEIRYRLVTRGRASQGDGWVPVVFRESGVVVERQSDDTVALVMREPVCGDCRVSFHLEIDVPDRTGEVDLHTMRGAIEVAGIAGSVNVRAVGGSISVEDVGGAVSASTAGGSIRLGTVGGPVTCDTAGGSIEVQRSGSAVLRTSVGGIRAANVHGDLVAETGGGSVEVGRVEGSVQVITGGGSIRVVEAVNGMQAQARAGDISIQRASGPLLLTSGAGDIVAGLLEGRDLKDSTLETAVGSIVVSLPESLALTLEASIRLAKGARGIVSEFPSVRVRRSEQTFGAVSEEAVGTINGGGSLVRIRNGVGRIEILKRR